MKGSEGRQFRDKLKHELGDGRDAPFWTGAWSRDKSLRGNFPRLFRLSKRSDGNVIDMGIWVDGVWKWKVR